MSRLAVLAFCALPAALAAQQGANAFKVVSISGWAVAAVRTQPAC
jgi:hypothetical protein